MRLSDLTKNISSMSEEELHAHVRQIRDNKYVLKPAVKKRVADVEKKEKVAGVKGIDKLIAGMSQEQIAAMLAKLQGGDGGN